MHIFTVTTTSDRESAGLGTTTKSVCSILQFSRYFTGRLGRSESVYICSLKVHTFKIFSAARSAAKFFYIFPASCGAAWPLHFKFASYAYALKRQCIERAVMKVGTTFAATACVSRHTTVCNMSV